MEAKIRNFIPLPEPILKEQASNLPSFSHWHFGLEFSSSPALQQLVHAHAASNHFMHIDENDVPCIFDLASFDIRLPRKYGVFLFYEGALQEQSEVHLITPFRFKHISSAAQDSCDWRTKMSRKDVTFPNPFSDRVRSSRNNTPIRSFPAIPV